MRQHLFKSWTMSVQSICTMFTCSIDWHNFIWVKWSNKLTVVCLFDTMCVHMCKLFWVYACAYIIRLWHTTSDSSFGVVLGVVRVPTDRENQGKIKINFRSVKIREFHRVWRTNTNTFHSNWFYVIVHAVDGVSLQYLFIQCQFTEINIIFMAYQ